MRNKFVTFGFCLAVVFGQPGSAQEGNSASAALTPKPLVLWKELYFEQSVADVVTAISRYPEVRSIKPATVKAGKPLKLKIKLVDSKIQIFGIGFEIEPQFSVSGKLQTVILTSGSECAKQSVDKITQIQSTLTRKYGSEIFDSPEFNDVTLHSVLLESLHTEKVIPKTYFYADNDIAVALVAGFNYPPRPQRVFGGGLAGSLSALAQNLYDSTDAACDNSGNQRVGYIIKYFPRALFDLEMKRTQDRINEESDQASKNL